MARFIAMELANQALAKQVQITNGIQDLVLDELVLITQAVFIKHGIFINHDGIINTATERQVVCPQVFDITHETESTGTTDLLDKGSAGEIYAGHLGPPRHNRVIEINLETYLEAVKGHKSGLFLAIADADFTQDADELLGCILVCQAC